MGRLTEIKSWEQVPEFDNEVQEAKFWATHYLSEELAEAMEVVDPVTFEPVKPSKKSSTSKVQTRRTA